MNSRLILRKTRIVGQFYLDQAGRDAAKALRIGDSVLLTPEPTNPHDPLAVVAHTAAGVKIGYASAEVSPGIALFATAGYRVGAVVVGFADKGQPNPLVDVTVAK